MSSESSPEISNQDIQQKSSRNDEKKYGTDLLNYEYKNKEIEKVCDNFVENLFLENPKSYESFVGNNVGVKKITEPNKKSDLKQEIEDKKYSAESSPIKDSKQDNNINDKKNETEPLKEINKEKNKDESDKENNSLLSNSKKNDDNSNMNTEAMNNICKDFIDEIFSQENAKYNNRRNNSGDELNIVGKTEHTKSKKSQFSNSSNKKSNNEQINKNSFKMTPEKVKYLIEHKKEIINIQKNWKRYYDVNRFKLLKYKTLIIQNFYRKYLIKKYNLPSNFYYNDKFLKMQTELYEEK